MLAILSDILRCPVSREKLNLTILSKGTKIYNGEEREIILDGYLESSVMIYPIIGGIPRLLVEAYKDYRSFLKKHVDDFDAICKKIEEVYGDFVKVVEKKNRHTKKAFEIEWGLFNYEEDKVWDEDREGMLQRFLAENNETKESLKGKWIFDAGCGNGMLNEDVGSTGANIVGMDFSLSVERAFEKNEQATTFFIQGDVQFPPVAFQYFDIVHSSGVLICTNNSELTFSCLSPCIKENGKMSIWLYHPRKNTIHNIFNWMRNWTSKLPLRLQYFLYSITLLPVSYVIKRLKGNKQNKREMMIDILDWFSPEFRWEHYHDEATAWFLKRNFIDIQVTTNEVFGFNIIGTKRSQ